LPQIAFGPNSGYRMTCLSWSPDVGQQQAEQHSWSSGLRSLL